MSDYTGERYSRDEISEFIAAVRDHEAVKHTGRQDTGQLCGAYGDRTAIVSATVNTDLLTGGPEARRAAVFPDDYEWDLQSDYAGSSPGNNYTHAVCLPLAPDAATESVSDDDG